MKTWISIHNLNLNLCSIWLYTIYFDTYKAFIGGLLFIFLVLCTNFILRNWSKSRTLNMCNNVPICFAPLNNNIYLRLKKELPVYDAFIVILRNKIFLLQNAISNLRIWQKQIKISMISNTLHKIKSCVLVLNSLNFLISKYCTEM